jgi:hypothetical protein
VGASSLRRSLRAADLAAVAEVVLHLKDSSLSRSFALAHSCLDSPACLNMRPRNWIGSSLSWSAGRLAAITARLSYAAGKPCNDTIACADSGPWAPFRGHSMQRGRQRRRKLPHPLPPAPPRHVVRLPEGLHALPT